MILETRCILSLETIGVDNWKWEQVFPPTCIFHNINIDVRY